MDAPTFEWRSAAAAGAVLHKSVVGSPTTFCGVAVGRLPARAPVDPARKGWPQRACKRCRRSWLVPVMAREIYALVEQAPAGTSRR